MITFLSESGYESNAETAIIHKASYRPIDIISLVPEVFPNELSWVNSEELVSLLSLEESLQSADISWNYESCVIFLKEDIISKVNKIVFDAWLKESPWFLNSSKIYIPSSFEYDEINSREYALKFYLWENYRKVLLDSWEVCGLTINPTRWISKELNIILSRLEFQDMPFINTVSLNCYLLMLNYLSSWYKENTINI